MLATKWLIVVVSVIVLSVCIGVFAFSSSDYVLSPEDQEKDEIIAIVVDFWKYTETGDYDKAKELRTDSWKGFTVTVENSEPPEKWIHSYGLRYLNSKISEEPHEGESKVAVRVLRSNGTEFYLFHDVVMTKNGWKILSTSY